MAWALTRAPNSLAVRYGGDNRIMNSKARDLHFSSLLVDCHADSPDRMVDQGEDLGRGGEQGHIDLPRMREGGLDAVFFSAWIRPELIPEKQCIQRVLQDIDAVKRLCSSYPDEIELATTAGDIRRIVSAGKLAAILCVEGGHAIEDDLAVLRQFYDLGVRYMTLTWSNNNNWADGCLDTPKHNGLTPFGVEVVQEMNRMGMMVDISHVSEKTFWDALKASSKPVIASHSSARAICDHPRNLRDEQIKAVADGGGVVCVTFVPAFISEDVRIANDGLREKHQLEEKSLEDEHAGDEAGLKRAKEALKAKFDEQVKQLPTPDLGVIVDHIEHMIDVAGSNHVGLGSDFDGVLSLPVGMEDCSKLPALTAELLRRGQSDDTVQKVLGGNLLRVMGEIMGPTTWQPT